MANYKLTQTGAQIQTDLNTVEGLATVAKTGSYNDLLNKPTFSILKLTQTEYDALSTKDENVLYVIVG